MGGRLLRVSLIVALPVLIVFITACGGGSISQERDITVSFDGQKLDPEIIRVNQGDPVTLRFNSTGEGEIHIHIYDFEVDVGPQRTPSVSFIANATGLFQIAFHPVGGSSGEPGEERTIGRLEVRP